MFDSTDNKTDSEQKCFKEKNKQTSKVNERQVNANLLFRNLTFYFCTRNVTKVSCCAYVLKS